MSSCMPSVPIQFQGAGICGGHGVCVNATRTLGLLLCKCDSLYSGASDFFDNRVEQLADGTWLSYSCNSSDVGTYVTWGIFVLFGILRTWILAPVWKSFYTKHYADSRLSEAGVWNDLPFRIVTMDLFGIGIPVFVTGFSKLAGMTLGTDALPTITLVIAIIFLQGISYDLSKLEFDIFVQGSSNPEEAKKAKRLRLILKSTSTFFYILFTGVVTLWTLSTDKAKGPLAVGGNGEEVAIYLRNLGAVFFGALEIASTWMIRKRVQQIRLVQGRDDSAVAYIIKRMDDEMKRYIILIFVLGTVYGIFCIPYLLPHQTYVIGLIAGLGLCRPHSKAFVTEREKRAKGFSTTTGPSRTSKEQSRRSVTGEKSKESGKQESGGKQESAEGRPDSSPALGSTFVQRDSVPSSPLRPAAADSVAAELIPELHLDVSDAAANGK